MPYTRAMDPYRNSTINAIRKTIIAVSGTNACLLALNFFLSITFVSPLSPPLPSFTQLYEHYFLPVPQIVLNLCLFGASLFCYKAPRTCTSLRWHYYRLIGSMLFAGTILFFTILGLVRIIEYIPSPREHLRACDALDEIGRINNHPCGIHVFVAVFELFVVFLVLLEGVWTFRRALTEQRIVEAEAKRKREQRMLTLARLISQEPGRLEAAARGQSRPVQMLDRSSRSRRFRRLYSSHDLYLHERHIPRQRTGLEHTLALQILVEQAPSAERERMLNRRFIRLTTIREAEEEEEEDQEEEDREIEEPPPAYARSASPCRRLSESTVRILLGAGTERGRELAPPVDIAGEDTLSRPPTYTL